MFNKVLSASVSPVQTTTYSPSVCIEEMGAHAAIAAQQEEERHVDVDISMDGALLMHTLMHSLSLPGVPRIIRTFVPKAGSLKRLTEKAEQMARLAGDELGLAMDTLLSRMLENVTAWHVSRWPGSAGVVVACRRAGVLACQQSMPACPRASGAPRR